MQKKAKVTIENIGTLGGDKIKFGELCSDKDKIFSKYRNSFAEIFN